MSNTMGGGQQDQAADPRSQSQPQHIHARCATTRHDIAGKRRTTPLPTDLPKANSCSAFHYSQQFHGLLYKCCFRLSAVAFILQQAGHSLPTQGGQHSPLCCVTHLQYVPRIIARVAGLVGNVPRQYGGVVTVHYACKGVLTQYDGGHVVFILCLQ